MSRGKGFPIFRDIARKTWGGHLWKGNFHEKQKESEWWRPPAMLGQYYFARASWLGRFGRIKRTGEKKVSAKRQPSVNEEAFRCVKPRRKNPPSTDLPGDSRTEGRKRLGKSGTALCCKGKCGLRQGLVGEAIKISYAEISCTLTPTFPRNESYLATAENV